MGKRKRSPEGTRNELLVREKRPMLQLNDLPKDILHTIISRLPIREAVRTSVLSSHWKHIWCSRTHLEFSFRSLVRKKGSRIPRSSISEYVFIERVDAVLKQHSGEGVEKLEVDFSPLHGEHTEHIDAWVKFAIASKTKQLIFDFVIHRPWTELYSFPFQFFDATSGSHLQSIRLGSIALKQQASIKFLVNLKKLELVNVNITNDELKVMLFNCKALEFFGISRCTMITSLHLHTPLHPLNHIKHLQVSQCFDVQNIELNVGLITLDYDGPLISLASPSTVRNLSIKSMDIHSSLAYIFTELPSTLPRLEMLTLRCRELKSATLPNKPFKFLCLKHLRLELNFVSSRKRRTDVLDLSCLLEVAPLMESLEVHMWMNSKIGRYHKNHGELRSLHWNPHAHLKTVDITGFYGQKDQLELALHILKVCTMLKYMKIDPRPMVASITLDLDTNDGLCFVNGYKVARKYLLKADHRDVVQVTKVRRRDVENVWPYKLIDPVWLGMVAEDE